MPVAVAEADTRKKTLGNWAVPRHARKVTAGRALKLETLFENAHQDWKWTNNADITTNYTIYEAHEPLLPDANETAWCTSVASMASEVVTMDTTGACTPAVLLICEVQHALACTEVWTLRFRMPRSIWETLERNEHGPGVLSRLLDVATTDEILSRLVPLAPVADQVALHPHLVSIVVGSCDGTTISTFGGKGEIQPSACPSDGLRLLLVAVPPQSRELEVCFTLLTHPSVFPEIDVDDSDADAGVPLSHVIQHHEQWGTSRRHASSAELAKTFNDAVAQTRRWNSCNDTEFLTLGGLLTCVTSNLLPYGKDGIQVCSSQLKRYCETRFPTSKAASASFVPAKEVAATAVNSSSASASASSSKAIAKTGSKPVSFKPITTVTAPAKLKKPQASFGLLDPSSEDEDDETTRSVPLVPAALSEPSRKRSPDQAKLTKVKGCAVTKKKKTKRMSEDSSDDDNEQLSSSSSVSNVSEEEDDSSQDEEEEDEEDEEDEEEADEKEDEVKTKPSNKEPSLPPAPKPKPNITHTAGARAQFSAVATYQMWSHVPDGQRFLTLLSAHPSSFSAARSNSIATDCNTLISSSHSTAEVFKASLYNRLLGHALGCLEDVLEERRPDQCVLVSKTEALAARAAAERAVGLCDHTLPQLDEAISKLKTLREQARASLVGIADDMPAFGGAATAPVPPPPPPPTPPQQTKQAEAEAAINGRPTESAANGHALSVVHKVK